jgi:radical SAM-linked protein
MFARVFRRARLPVAWTRGFNPHPVMAFALPLAVGVSSECEYADIGMAQRILPDECVDRLNRCLPEGFQITAASDSDGRGLMGSVYAAAYRLCFEATADPATDADESIDATDAWSRIVAGIMTGDPVPVSRIREHQGRKVTQTIDIRPFIRTLQDISRRDGILQADALLDAGSRSNLRPDLLSSIMISRMETRLAENPDNTVRIRLRGIHRVRLLLTVPVPEGRDADGLGEP